MEFSLYSVDLLLTKADRIVKPMKDLVVYAKEDSNYMEQPRDILWLGVSLK